jgi:hypothetical protein
MPHPTIRENPQPFVIVSGLKNSGYRSISGTASYAQTGKDLLTIALAICISDNHRLAAIAIGALASQAPAFFRG